MDNEIEDDFIKSFKPLLEQIQQLQEQAYYVYKPQIEHLIETKTKDENAIGRLLDHLLDNCGNDKVLLLYKKLCRYYWDIDPVATAFYIQSYREMWDDETTIDEI
ncbi:hypothetical protein [Flavobacterium gilvum]|uniref:Uncharacterized protein n=1 Tax=Flavobacterium gilvum TaxID=1492737 RepID=A0AAC9N7T0_9FLAO|nr:hypothetical protein [Flavobacterium gilvum]AOW11023.1 hypothetical protein EM308_16870 [Flavobacterium gilvum]KFC59177.1 hypothetical protein FEM08_20380 [Flavobacterium gilvum]